MLIRAPLECCGVPIFTGLDAFYAVLVLGASASSEEALSLARLADATLAP
jgi:hypothetical protein